MDGFGSHTFQWVNAAGERFWVKFHFKTDQGIRCFTAEEAERVGGQAPTYAHTDLYEAIGRGEHPSWTLKVQVMPEAQAATYRFNPFDLTKVWPYRDHPLIPIGRLVLDRVPDNFFAETEQAAFDPANMVDGIGPSPDRMLQARLFGYGDAHRYRLGINHTRLPVNAPRGVPEGAKNYGRDGAMRFDDNGGRAKNYEPNSFDTPAQTGARHDRGFTVSGTTGSFTPVRHAEDDDFVQAGNLYRILSEVTRQRLVAAIAGGLSQVSREDIIEPLDRTFSGDGQGVRRPGGRGRRRPAQAGEAMTAVADGDRARPGAEAGLLVAGADDDALAIARRAVDLARQGDAEGLAGALALGLPADVRTASGDSLLMLAAYHGRQEAVRLLLERGANPDLVNDRGQSPLAGAAFKGDAGMVELLVAGGAVVDAAGADGRTALMYAAMFDRVDVIDVLLRHGARPDRVDRDGRSARQHALTMGAGRAAARLDAGPPSG